VPGSKGISSVAYSPGSSLLAAGDASGRIYLWNHKHLRILTDPHRTAIRSVAFTFDGQYLAAGDAMGRIYLFSVDSARTRSANNGGAEIPATLRGRGAVLSSGDQRPGS
jgi:WD40 repeat protein